MHPDIRLVVFDMAGTTLRDQHEVEACFAQAIRTTELQVSDERILAVQGMGKLSVFQMLWAEQIGADHPEYAAKVSHSYELFKEILENHYRTQPVEPTEGCLEVFDLLHEKGINIALTTGFYRQVTDIILARLGWKVASREVVDRQADTWVDFSITSDEVAQGRPAPDMIFRAMQHFGLTDPKQVVNIGDTPSDLASGKAAGCYFSLGLTNGTHTHAQLASHPHDALLPSLHAFKALAVEGFRK